MSEGAAPKPPLSKAARNERRKLQATLLNNLAVAFLLSAFLSQFSHSCEAAAPTAPSTSQPPMV